MISFKMFAGTNVGLRDNNEDNFTVCPDLTKNEWIVPADNQQAIQLGERGCVMVVADGMGGQNAGEVASAIAIDTVQDLLSPNKLPADVLNKTDAIKQFLKKVILECDNRIKDKTKEDASTFGMGSTIVISWLVNRKLYVAWLGDSRAYSFVPNKGIARLSKDHSYVQQLVDAGTITEEEAMNHPNSNVITRSLGDTSQKAKADVAEYEIEDGQIILLCSDGLCGVCKDEEIGGIIEAEEGDLQKCKETLSTAALAAGGSDNITVSLMQISIGSNTSSKSEELSKPHFNKNSIKTILTIVFGLSLLLLLFTGYTKLFSSVDSSINSISLSVDSDVLSQNDKTHYHVLLSNDKLSYDIIYDNTLLKINTTDSIISRVKTKHPLMSDSITYIKVVCKQDTSIKHSMPIILKRMEVIEFFQYKETSSALGLSGSGTDGLPPGEGSKEIVVGVSLGESLGESPGNVTQNVTTQNDTTKYDTTKKNNNEQIFIFHRISDRSRNDILFR